MASTTFLNMSICHYLQQQYQKSVEKATRSLDQKKTSKGYFRRGKANMMLQKFEDAAKDFEAAVKLDPSDPNDIQQELAQAKAKFKQQEKERINKLSGFLLKSDKE